MPETLLLTSDALKFLLHWSHHHVEASHQSIISASLETTCWKMGDRELSLQACITCSNPITYLYKNIFYVAIQQDVYITIASAEKMTCNGACECADSIYINKFRSIFDTQCAANILLLQVLYKCVLIHKKIFSHSYFLTILLLTLSDYFIRMFLFIRGKMPALKELFKACPRANWYPEAFLNIFVWIDPLICSLHYKLPLKCS